PRRRGRQAVCVCGLAHAAEPAPGPTRTRAVRPRGAQPGPVPELTPPSQPAVQRLDDCRTLGPRPDPAPRLAVAPRAHAAALRAAVVRARSRRRARVLAVLCMWLSVFAAVARVRFAPGGAVAAGPVLRPANRGVVAVPDVGGDDPVVRPVA